MRSVSLLKYISKSVHSFTAFVYLFTFLGPSISLATSTITYTETVQEEQIVRTQHSLPPSSLNTVSSTPVETQTVLPTLRLDTREAYKRYDLSVTPENSSIRQGIHFRFQNYDSPEESLGTFVNFNGPFPYSNFSPLIKKDLQTGFTVSLPEFGQIQCDWQGNLKLVGLHTTHPETPALALNLVTSGTVEFSDVTLANLSLKAKKATFLKDVTIQEESVFDIETLDLASSGFENTKRMTFLSKTRFLSKQIWRNKGGISGEKSLSFDNTYFSNLSSVHSKRYLRLISDYFANYHGTFHGDLGTTVRAKSGFYNNYGGKITSGGLTRVAFFMANGNDLGDIRGQKVVLEDLSGAEHFTLKNGKVTAQERVTLVGNSPEMPKVHFVTPQLVLDADGFDLGEQNEVERTLIMRSKDQNFTLTKDYKTDGTLEIWQRDLYTREDVQEALFERFGDETGEVPEPDSLIDLQASIKAAGGLAFFTPSAKVRLGDAAKEALREFTSQNGWLEAYATAFDLEKGTLVAENAHVHAPGGILTGRLDKDENEDLFSEKLYRQNGSTLLVRGTVTLKGPWHHRGDFLSSFLVLDSPKDHLFEAATGRVLQDCELKGGGDLYLKRRLTAGRYLSSNLTLSIFSHLIFSNSNPSYLHIDNEFDANDSILYNNGSVFYAFSKNIGSQFKDIDVTFFPDPDSVIISKYSVLAGVKEPLGLKKALIEHSEEVDSPIGNSVYQFTRPHPTYNCSGYLSSRDCKICYRFYLTGYEGSILPNQTSFGTGTTVTPDENGITTIGGDFQASTILVLIGQGSAEIGSVPTLVRQRTPTHSPLQSLLPETFKLTVLTMSENLRRLMNQNPEVDTFFRFTPRFWFEPDEAQRFHAELRPHVRVQSPQGGFETLDGQALFTLTPDMLIKAVQDKALEVLGRGNIEDNRKIDEDQILELHRNFAEYLEETGFAGSDLTGALMDPNSALPWPKKPFICYTSAMNEEGVLELSPVIWLPQEMHKKSGIQTRLLLSIPMGMSFNDLLNYAQNNEMLRDSLQLLLTNNAEMIPQINRLALTYREDNGLGDDDELPPAGPIAFNGGIEADSFMTFNTGTVMNHADVTCQDAVLMSLGGSVVMSSLVERENRGNGNFQDRILAQARLRAGNLIKMFAQQDIVFQGAETISEVSTHILALADILDIPAVLVSQRTEQLSGKYSGTETWMHVHNHVSRHISGGELTNEAGGKQELHGTHYDAGKLVHHAKKSIKFAAVRNQTHHSWQGKKGSKSRQESISRTTARGGVHKSRNSQATITSEDSDLIFEATAFLGGHGAIIKALNGRVEFLLGRNTLESSSMSSSQGAMWMKNTQKSENHLTFTVPTTDGPIEVEALETLLQSIDGQHLAFLDDLDVQGGSFVNQVIKELHESHSKTVQGPGMALAIIVAVVVTCCTGGSGGTLLAGALGSLMGGGAVGSTLGVICAAAINAGITNHILDTMSNGGDVFKAFAKGVSKERLKDAAVSGISAGITHGVDQGLTKVFGDVSKMTTLGQHARSATNKIVSLGARTGFENLVRGTDFKDGFVDGLKHIGAEVALDGLTEGTSSLASNDNVPSSSTPTVSKKPEVKGTLESFGNHVQQSGARMARGLTVNLLAGDDPRDVVIKTIAAFAAEVVCFGVAEGYQGFTGILGEEEEFDDRLAVAMPSPQQNGRSQGVDSEIPSHSSPRHVSRDQEFDFLADHLPKLKQNIEYVVDKIAEQLGVIDDNLADLLHSFKGSLRSNAEDVYQCLREAGHSMQVAWDETLKSTSVLFQRGAEEIIQNDPLRSVALPLVPVALGAITGLGTLITGLAIQDHIERNMSHGNGTTFGHQEGFSIPEGVNDPSVETFPIPNVSDTEELPPYVAHPDDFASTRGTGGYGPYADGTIPNILSTPILDTDSRENIFINERGSDKWSRAPKSLQDEMALEAAKRGEGIHLENLELGDPRYKGMHKMRLTVKSDAGKDSVIHYVFNPETGETMDFKFKKHSTD